MSLPGIAGSSTTQRDLLQQEQQRALPRLASTPVQLSQVLNRSTSSFFSQLGTVHVECIVRLTPVQFTVVWWLFMTTHLLASVYFFYVTYLHYYIILVHFDPTIATLGDHVMGYFSWVMVINGTFCGLHGACVIGPLLGSIQQRELCFEWPRTTSSSVHQSQQSETDKKETARRSSRYFHSATQLHAKFFGHVGLFGLESVHFDVVFRLLEAIVGTAQTYQAWKLSNLVPTVWINRMYAIILVLSFWSSPCLHFLYGDRVALHRVLMLAMDTFLDLIALTVFPLAIFLPYANLYVPDHGDFPMFFYYEDTQFINAVAENQHLFVMSPFDLITKSIPVMSVLVSLVSLRGCLAKSPTAAATRRQTLRELNQPPPVRPTVTATARAQFPGRAPQIVPLGVNGPAISAVAMATSQRRGAGAHVRPWWEKRFHRIVDLLFVLWGVLIALVHLYATAVANLNRNDGCYLNLRPWFSTTYDCAVLEVNCETLGHVGHDQDMTQALQGFNDAMLRALILTGCPELEMPPRIQDFPSLQMLKIYNSSIQKWTSDAALTGTHHPTITLLYIVHTNFSDPSTLPPGLLSDDFPESLQDIEFCGTNLVSLPRVLKAKWHFVQYFVLENSPGITEFPMALVELRVPQLSLCGNQITSIPDHLLVNQSFWSLSLTGNPITSLPASIGAWNKLYRIRVGFTGLTSVPSWMNDPAVVPSIDTFWKVVDVKAGGSPLCQSDGGDHGGLVWTNPYFVKDCTMDLKENWPQVYPLAEEEAMRTTRLAALRNAAAS